MLHFPQFVLVGMPASEARNALLSPLAGHEFGHSVWSREGIESNLKMAFWNSTITRIRARFGEWKAQFPNLTNETELGTSVAYTEAWAPAFYWSLYQAQEVFCDFIGLLLFDTAYLHAFAYLLAPGIPSPRIASYPTLRQRAEYLVGAATDFGIAVPQDYAQEFEDIGSGRSKADFLVSLADQVVQEYLLKLRERARDYLDQMHISRVQRADIDPIIDEFTLLAPAALPASLPAIINAGWEIAQQKSVWQEFPRVAEKRYDVLNDLVVKSAEVLEFRERTFVA
jgi:hypothetical protein